MPEHHVTTQQMHPVARSAVHQASLSLPAGISCSCADHPGCHCPASGLVPPACQQPTTVPTCLTQFTKKLTIYTLWLLYGYLLCVFAVKKRLSVFPPVCHSPVLYQNSLVYPWLRCDQSKCSVDLSSYQLWSQCSTIKHIVLWPSNRQLH